MTRLFTVALFALASSAMARSLDFDYRDPKEMSAVSLTLDSLLEPMVGYARGISGHVRFDPRHPERAGGKVAVEVASVQFSNDGYTQTARGYALNGAKWPQLTLEIRKVESVKETAPNRYEGVILADFTCRGVTKPKRLKVSASYLPGRAEERTNGQHKGDLLILRTQFGVSRREHGISEGIPDDLVGDTVQVGVAVVGIHYTKAATAPAAPAKAEAETRKAVLDAKVALDGATPLGAKVPLETIAGKGPLVLFFFNEQCGVTYSYKSRLRRLLKDFGAKGFAFAGVRTGLRQFPDRAVEVAEAKYLAMPFFDDAEGILMERFGVEQSLTFAVIDRAGRLRYLGGFDDNVNETSVRSITANVSDCSTP
ncbi:redoxin domain-containing protein, partial [bacterium]